MHGSDVKIAQEVAIFEQLDPAVGGLSNAVETLGLGIRVGWDACEKIIDRLYF